MRGTTVITRQALDYLPVAIRAAERAPESATLWAEAIRVQRAVIDAGDATCTEHDAARIQSYVGSLATLATRSPSADTVASSERVKARILALASA